MTVKELIEELSYMPDDAEVRFTYSYGDRWHSVLADTPSGVEQGRVRWSDYHSAYKVLDEDDDKGGESCVLIVAE